MSKYLLCAIPGFLIIWCGFMDNAQEVRHRWRTVFELAIIDLRIRKMRETITEEQLLADVKFLQERVDELEKDLGDALNPVSSSFGVLTLVQDGELYYRINGKFLPVREVNEAVQLLEETNAKKRKDQENEHKDDQTEIQ